MSLFLKARYRKTMFMVMRFGMQFWYLGIMRRFCSEAAHAAAQKELHTKQAREFTDRAMEMGGLLIKLGQHVSSRIDLLPPEYTEELSKLQDCAPAVPTQEIIAIIQQEFDSPLSTAFARFEETAVASASLGQVHKAQLHSGEEVAVKVLRPHIREIIDIDLQSLSAALKLADRFTSLGNYMDVDLFYQEFKDTITRELDLKQEGASAETIQRNFLDNPNVDIPKIHWGRTTQSVLTMEYMHGVKISDFQQLDAWGVDRNQLASNLVEIYLQMIFEDGVFHADPHPGNVLVREDGIIELLDFGMMGTLESSVQKDFIDLIIAAFLKDSGSVIDALRKLGFLRAGADTGIFTKNLDQLFARLDSGGTMMDASVVTDNADELREFMYSQPFQLPGNITFLGKALFTVTGIASGLSPEIDYIEEARPYFESEFNLGSGLTGDVLEKVLAESKNLLLGIIPVTKKVLSVVDKLDCGTLPVKLSKAQERTFIETMAAQNQKIVRTIIGGVLFTTGMLMQNAHPYSQLSYFAIGAGGLIMLLQLRSGSRTKKRRRRMRHGDMFKG